MDINEIKNYFETNGESEEVKKFYESLRPNITPDYLSSLYTSDTNVQSWLDSEKDKHSNKSLETWKANNLQKLIDEEIAKRYPEEDPKDKAVRDLQKRLEDMENEKTRQKLINLALKEGKDAVPSELIPFLIGEDEAATAGNVKTFKEALDEKVAAVVAEKLKGSYRPSGESGDLPLKTNGIEAVLKNQRRR